MAGLSSAVRVRRRADFLALRSAAGRWHGNHFVLRWVASSADCARLGLAVSRKVSKRAVVRNRIKRVARESFRLRRAAMPTVDVLVIARASAAASDNAALRADLERGWQTLKRRPSPGTIAG